MYSIIDIETTGTGSTGNRITEIALYNTDGKRILESFSSLVNPGCEIPSFITGLTGITTAMVRRAPTFEEVAPKILELTKGRVFVAHSVNFDYPIVKKEFQLCGLDYSRKKLCTVRLSRRLFPGLRSYSLGKLCSSLGIPLTDRHRAAGDAKATTLLFQRLIAQQEGPNTISSFLNARSQEATLPPHLSRESFERIPSEPGVYYFKDTGGQVIYVGKAIDLKKRVLGHFYDSSQRERALCRETSTIDFERSGSELLALLMEAAAIKRYFPKYNRAQKSLRPAYGLFSYRDRDGVVHLAINRARKGQQAHKLFFNQAEARLFTERICREFELCAKYCHLQEGVTQCGHFRLPSCGGICRGTEAIDSYNQKALRAIESLKGDGENILIGESGRHAEERAVIWISGGRYRGYGFVEKAHGLHAIPDPGTVIIPQHHYPETDRILQSYLIKNPDKIVRLQAVLASDSVMPAKDGEFTFF